MPLDSENTVESIRETISENSETGSRNSNKNESLINEGLRTPQIDENSFNAEIGLEGEDQTINKLKTHPDLERFNKKAKEEEEERSQFNEITTLILKASSIYHICKEKEKTKLFVYDTDSQREEIKILKTPERLDLSTCITQLPNGELFCFGNNPNTGITLLIDSNNEVRVLQSGISCRFSSSVYFNSNVYCFGGLDNDDNPLDFSCKFNLSKNLWIKTALMPQADRCCHSIIFNGRILISGLHNRNLLMYSIDINSFSTIDYDFGEDKSKILINLDRLYLIECNGLIYESEIGSESTWNHISKSIISDGWPDKIYCSYNNGRVYISILRGYIRQFYKFDLDRKCLIDIGLYNKHVALRRLDNDFKTIECLSKHSATYVNKECSLNDLGQKFEEIECCNELIRLNPNDFDAYFKKGQILIILERYQEALECFDKTIKPYHCDIYSSQRDTDYALERFLDEIRNYKTEDEYNPKSYLSFCYCGLICNEIQKETEAKDNFEKAHRSLMLSNVVQTERHYKYRLKLLETLHRLQQSAVKNKEEFQKLKDAAQNQELIKKIEEKEAIVKKQHSHILSKATNSLDFQNNDSIELLEQIEKEAAVHPQEISNILIQLKLSLENKK